MGSQEFPPALYGRIVREGYDAGTEPSVTVQQTTNPLSEFRLYNGEAWRASFTVKTRTVAERATLRDFHKARKGRWDSFFFRCRDDGVSRRVVFAEFAGTITGPLTAEFTVTLKESAT
jgi:hypothetical protein